MNNKGSRKFAPVILCVALLFMLVLGSVGHASAASVIYVNAAASGLNNGTSWTDAYIDLQSALAAAVSGDQIWVAQGTYYPTPGSDRHASFHLKSGVGIYGGFIGKETQLNPRNPYAHKTILSGDIGVPGDASGNSFHVVDSSGVSRGTLLDGFMIEYGNANGGDLGDFGDATNSLGAGIYNKDGYPTLSRLIIERNRSNFEGGGMYTEATEGGGPTLTNVDFIRNFAAEEGGGLAASTSSPSLSHVIFSSNGGGGMAVWGDSSPLLRDVTFAGNENTLGVGGGMWVGTNATPKIEDTTFNNNSSDVGGGGLATFESTPTLINVTFNGNKTALDGGAIYNRQSNPLFRNITVSGNTAGRNGGGMFSEQGSAAGAENSIFWGDGTEIAGDVTSPSTLTDSIVQGGCPTNAMCTNVIMTDPILGKLKYNGGATYTMALGDGSAAIDAGGVNLACSAADQRGMARPQGPACDIGAYEVGVMTFYSVGTYDGSVLESGAGTGVGGTVNSTGQTFQVGDNASNQQYRGFLSFDTSTLPKSAKIVLGKLGVRQSDAAGASPFASLGSLHLDLAKPFFGSSLALTSGDFQASAVVPWAGSFGSAPSNGWYISTLASSGYAAINQAGTTQFRLEFTKPTDGNNAASYLVFYSGDYSTTSYQPTLWVYYNP